MDRQLWAQDDEAGRVLAIFARRDPDLDEKPVAALRVSSEVGGTLAHYLITPGDAIELVIAVHKACGQPVPVITPRPEIDPRLDYRFGPLTVRPARGGSVPVEMGTVTEGLAPHVARRLAGALAARADEADGQEPDPAATLADRIGALLSLGLPLDVIAVRLLADGWSRALHGEGDGNA